MRELNPLTLPQRAQSRTPPAQRPAEVGGIQRRNVRKDDTAVVQPQRAVIVREGIRQRKLHIRRARIPFQGGDALPGEQASGIEKAQRNIAFPRRYGAQLVLILRLYPVAEGDDVAIVPSAAPAREGERGGGEADALRAARA